MIQSLQGPFSIRPARPEEFSELVSIDDAARTLFKSVGMDFDVLEGHPFAMAERARWARAVDLGLARVAVTREDHPVGFMALSVVDAAPHVEQLSVRPDWMRRGIGTALIQHALAWSGRRALAHDVRSHPLECALLHAIRVRGRACGGMGHGVARNSGSTTRGTASAGAARGDAKTPGLTG